MTVYLGFVSVGFRFLVDIGVVQEVFNVSASPVNLNTVLVGDGCEIYWRGIHAKMINFVKVLGEENSMDANCYIVCKPLAGLIVLKVDDVSRLYNIDDADIVSMAVDSENLAVMTRSLYVNPENGETAFILNDLQEIGVFSESLMQKQYLIN